MLNNKSNSKHFLLIYAAIVLVAALLRLVALGSLPRVLNPDEAAIGYNAILLAQTGMDEWGERWPITLVSFGDYKLIGYPAIASLLFSIFDPSEFLLRLPSAIAGVSLVFAAFYWSRRLKHPPVVQLLCAAFLATTPVFIFYSRMAFEANLALAMVIWSQLLFFRPAATQSHVADAGALTLYAAACLTYNTPLLLAPFVIVLLIWWRGIRNISEWWFPVGGMIGVSILSFEVLRTATEQKSAITIFSDPGFIELSQTFSHRVPSFFIPFAKPPVYFAFAVLERLVRSFGIGFLVMRGGAHPWHSLPYWGHVSGTVYLFGILGIVSAAISTAVASVRSKLSILVQPLQNSELGTHFLLLCLLFVGLAPAVVTTDAPHATRSLLFLFVFVIFAAEGCAQVLRICQRLRNRVKIRSEVVAVVIVLLILIPAIRYSFSYFFWYPSNHPPQLPVGVDVAVQTVRKQYPNSQIAIVDPHGTLYIMVSWYEKYSADYFFETIRKQLPTPIGFRYGERVGQFHFIARPQDRTTEAVMLQYEAGEWLITP